MTKEDVINQISGEDWIHKGGLDIPEDIFGLLDNPFGWFQDLKPINFAMESNQLPTLKNILSYFPEDELGGLVKVSSLEMLKTSYGINKCFNSRTHDDLQAKANQLLTNSQIKKRDNRIYHGTVQAYNFFLNMSVVNKSLSLSNYNGQMDY